GSADVLRVYHQRGETAAARQRSTGEGRSYGVFPISIPTVGCAETQSYRLPRQHRRADIAPNEPWYFPFSRRMAGFPRIQNAGHLPSRVFAAQSGGEGRSLERSSESH